MSYEFLPHDAILRLLHYEFQSQIRQQNSHLKPAIAQYLDSTKSNFNFLCIFYWVTSKCCSIEYQIQSIEIEILQY